MSESTQAWNDVASRVTDLGRKLKTYFDEAAPDKASMNAALEGLRDALDRSFSTIGNAVKDPEVKQDVVGVARSMRDAFAATFAEASEDLRGAFKPKDGESGTSTT